MTNMELEDGGLEAQLNLLYADRERLESELGTSDPDELVEMVRSLEAQLQDLYREKESAADNRLEVQIEGNKVIIYGPDSIQIRKKKID